MHFMIWRLFQVVKTFNILFRSGLHLILHKQNTKTTNNGYCVDAASEESVAIH